MLVYKIGAHKQMKRFSTVTVVTLAVALFALLAAVPATASTLLINETGSPFDNIQAFGFGPGATFNGVGLSGFTAGTWTSALHSPTWAVATDGNQSNTNFTVDLSMSGTGYLDLFAFNNVGTIVDSARFG